jgi:hypothetical protein
VAVKSGLSLCGKSRKKSTVFGKKKSIFVKENPVLVLNETPHHGNIWRYG